MTGPATTRSVAGGKRAEKLGRTKLPKVSNNRAGGRKATTTPPSPVPTVVKPDGTPSQDEEGAPSDEEDEAPSDDSPTKPRRNRRDIKKSICEKNLERKRKIRDTQKDVEDRFLEASLATANQEKKEMARVSKAADSD